MKKIMIVMLMTVIFVSSTTNVPNYAMGNQIIMQTDAENNDQREAMIENLLEQRREIRSEIYLMEDEAQEKICESKIKDIENRLLDLGVVVNGESKIETMAVERMSIYPDFSMFSSVYDISAYDTTRNINGTTYTVHIVEVEDNGKGNGLIRKVYTNDYVVKGKITTEYTASYFLESAISFGAAMALSAGKIPAPIAWGIGAMIDSVVKKSEPYKLITGTDVCILEETVVDEYGRYIYVFDESNQSWEYVGCSNYIIQDTLFSYTYLSGKTVKIYPVKIRAFQNHSSDGTYTTSITKAVEWFVTQKGLGVTRFSPVDLRMSSSIVTFKEVNSSGTTEKELARFPARIPLESGMLPCSSMEIEK